MGRAGNNKNKRNTVGKIRGTDPYGNQQTESGQVAISALQSQDIEKMEENRKGEIQSRILKFGDPSWSSLKDPEAMGRLRWGSYSFCWAGEWRTDLTAFDMLGIRYTQGQCQGLAYENG